MPAAVETAQVFKLGQSRVYTSETLTTADNWTARPYLYCDQWRDVAGPDIGGGTLVFDYGLFDIREHDLFTRAVGSGTYQPLNIQRHYVKIEVLDGDAKDDPENTTPIKTHYGRIVAIEDVSAFTGGTDQKTGKLVFTVYDLKCELADVILRTSNIETITNPVQIGQAVGFNIAPGGVRARHGNRAYANSPDYRGYEFSWIPSPDDDFPSDLTTPEKWTATKALEYLVEYDTPRDKDGIAPVTWDLVNHDAVGWYDITVQREGRSALDVLNELVDRRRLVGYVLECDDSGAKFAIDIKLFTFTDVAIDMPGAVDLPANADTTTLVAQTSPVTDAIVLGDVATHQADKIRVEGERITMTFTLIWNETADEEQLIDGWKDSIETAYLAAAGGDADANTLHRLQDLYEDVFSRFVLSDSWNQKVKRQSDDQEFHVVIPVEDLPDEIEDAEVEGLFDADVRTDGGPWWHRGHRFLPHLAAIDSESKQYRPMFVLFEDGDEADAADRRYKYAEKLNAPGGTTAFEFASHVYVLPDRPGIKLRVTRHGGQQLIANASWGGAADTPAELDPTSASGVNYEDMLVTVTMERDARCYAEEVIDDTRASLREVLIRVPDMRLDIELPGCVTDVTETGAVVESTGKILRDDRERGRDIAKAAAAWYGTSRKAARLTYSTLVPIVSVGQFITDLVIGGTTEEINTPVTGIAYDFVGGRVFVETSYADADFT